MGAGDGGGLVRLWGGMGGWHVEWASAPVVVGGVVMSVVGAGFMFHS